MSQYRINTPDGRWLIYGFDRPLCEYFFQLTHTEPEIDAMSPEDGRSAEYKYAIGNDTVLTPHPDYPTKMKYTTDEMLIIVKDYLNLLPDSHLLAIAMGLPF